MTVSLAPAMSAPQKADTGRFDLHAGALRLALRPDLGGCIAGLWHDHTPILRSQEPGSVADVRDAASFPLVPYSNRIALRRFRFKGHDHVLAPNFPGPHAIHGVGWRRPWTLHSHSAFEAVLTMVHSPDEDWPYAFESRQHIGLSPDQLRLQLSVTNTFDAPQPVGLGWHPYFPKRERSRLHAELSHRWDADPTLLPVRKTAQPGIDTDISHLDVDNVYEGWNGLARIRDEKFSLQMHSSLPYLVVYARPDKDHFCVEPVSHVNNAIHMSDPAAHGLRTLAPGETFDAWMSIDITVL